MTEKLYSKTAHELSDLIKKKEVSAVDIVKSQIKRIEEVEDSIGSYITLVPQLAVKNAEKIDAKLSEGEDLGALAGIPFAAKDNICTNGILTTCASKMLHNFAPPYNATVMDKLDGEGSILIGKTNLDEFAMGSSTESSYFKKTKNPFNLDYVPGGSSGGSATAVSADEAVFALGTDTGGSIRQPSAFCGVVGFKPTYGLVSRYGVVPLASSLDQAGTITKDVEDCALVLNAITGNDKRDATSLKTGYEDFTKALNSDVKNLKIGLPKEYFGEDIDREIKEAILAAAKNFEEMGAIVEECSLPMTDYSLSVYYVIASAEASSNLARYDGVRYGFRAENYEDLDDLYYKTRSQGFGDEVKRRIMLGTFVLSHGYYDIYFRKAQKVRTLIKQDFDNAFSKYDLLLAPTTPNHPWKIGENNTDILDSYARDICTVSANIAGLPSLTMPCGVNNNGLPMGLQLIGKPLGDATLIRAAHAYEQSKAYTKIKPSFKEEK